MPAFKYVLLEGLSPMTNWTALGIIAEPTTCPDRVCLHASRDARIVANESRCGIAQIDCRSSHACIGRKGSAIVQGTSRKYIIFVGICGAILVSIFQQLVSAKFNSSIASPIMTTQT
jgi:hypothetical protein